MKILIAGGTGFIGSALVAHWQSTPHELTVLGRNQKKIVEQFGEKVKAIDWQQFRADPKAILEKVDVVINLCGDNIGQGRWTKIRKQQIKDARIPPTLELATACAELGKKSPHLINASGVSIYGLQSGSESNFPAPFTEENALPQSANDFMSQLAMRWEQATEVASLANVPVTLARFGVILSRDGGALPKMAMPFYFGLGGPVGTGLQPLSWVSMQDVCRMMDFVIQHRELTGPLNFVGIQSVRQREFAHTLAKTLNRPAYLTLPVPLVKLLFGQMGEELLLQGQNTIPDRLINAGCEFTHPTLEVCLRELYSTP